MVSAAVMKGATIATVPAMPIRGCVVSACESRFGAKVAFTNGSFLNLESHARLPQASRRSENWRTLIVTNAAATKVKSPAEVDWKIKRETLLKAKVRSVSPKEALALQKEQGYAILDVRPGGDHITGHPAGATNVQVYRLIKEWTLWDISRRVAFAFFGIFQGTEENPEFLKEVNAAFAKDDKIIVCCIAGGTMKPSPNLAEGSQSRSLIAAYLLVLDGFTNVLHMEGGLKQWFKLDLPTDEVVED